MGTRTVQVQDPAAAAFYREHFQLSGKRQQVSVPCPFHEDNRASLSVNLASGLWNCHAGCGSGTLQEFQSRLNGNGHHPKPQNGARQKQTWTFGQLSAQQAAKHQPEAEYVYCTPAGVPVFRKLRLPGKNFRVERAQGNAWVSMLAADTPRLLYNLPAVSNATTLIWCEGEKDADRVQTVIQKAGKALAGFAATTTYDGADGAWRADEYGPPLKGKEIIILPDNDPAGGKYADAVARGAMAAEAASVALLALPGLPEKGDVSDYLDAHSPKEFIACLPNARQWADPVDALFVTAAQVAARAPEQVPWLVEGLLAEGTSTQLMGKPKMGKSTLVHHMLAALLQGKRFLGRTVKKIESAVYLTEMPETDLRAELRSLPELLRSTGLHILFWHAAIGYTWEQAVQGAIARARRVGARLLIIDTFSVWARIKDENSASEVLAALAAVQPAITAGMSVLLETHERKTGGEIYDASRGSGALTGSVSIAATIRMPEGNHKTNPSLRAMEVIGRHGNDRFVVELTAEGYAFRGTSHAVTKEQAETELWDLLPDDEAKAVPLKALTDKANRRRTTVQKILAEWLHYKVVMSKGKAKSKSNPVVYWRMKAIPMPQPKKPKY